MFHFEMGKDKSKPGNVIKKHDLGCLGVRENLSPF